MLCNILRLAGVVFLVNVAELLLYYTSCKESEACASQKFNKKLFGSWAHFFGLIFKKEFVPLVI